MASSSNRFHVLPGSEVIDLEHLLYVNQMEASLRIPDDVVGYSFNIGLTGSIILTIMNLSRDERKAEGYRQALIDAWKQYHESKQ